MFKKFMAGREGADFTKGKELPEELQESFEECRELTDKLAEVFESDKNPAFNKHLFVLVNALANMCVFIRLGKMDAERAYKLGIQIVELCVKEAKGV